MLMRSQSRVGLEEYDVRRRERCVRRLWDRNERGVCGWCSVNVGNVIGDGVR